LSKCEARVGNQAVVIGAGTVGRCEAPPGCATVTAFAWFVGGGRRALDELFPGFKEEFVRVSRARAVSRAFRTGRVYIEGPPPDMSAPFGGYRMSGNGRETAS
jgi:hypothetical protein